MVRHHDLHERCWRRRAARVEQQKAAVTVAGRGWQLQNCIKNMHSAIPSLTQGVAHEACDIKTSRGCCQVDT